MSQHEPTKEQRAALDLFAKGDSMVIEAGAGTGKTTTLELLAHATDKRGRYMAFNRAIVTDVKGRMPSNVAASTAHSMAFRSIGKAYAHRLNSGRMRAFELAQRLGVDPFVVRFGAQRKRLSDGFLAGLVMRGIGVYCQTCDEMPTWRHIPYLDGIDLPNDDGTRRYDMNDQLRQALEPALLRAWADIASTAGQLPFKHDHYLKLWQLSHPRTAVDFILFDEAQDANPVMAGVVAEQTHAQRVYVGDSAQAIYEFTGAVNAMASFDTEHRTYLSQSFRFGEAIAAEANKWLGMLGAPLRLQGLRVASTVGPMTDPDAVLCRTNAGAMERTFTALARGEAPHLVGGGKEVASFARAAQSLQAGDKTFHPELACFDSWGEVQEYVEQDQQGHELRLLVSLVDEFGADKILDALDRMPGEGHADVIISTAHKAKGREWARVQVHEDFADVELSPAEMRLRYVAVTRARVALDVTAFDAEPKRKPLDDDGEF